MTSRADIATELRALEQENGRLLPADVVEAARDPQSPMHAHFTWDDTEAARKHRLNEARTLIRTVTLEVTVQHIPLSVCAYVRDPESDPKQAGYRNVEKVRTEEDLARAILVDEMKRVGNAIARAKKLAVLFGAQEEIEQIEALAQTVTDRIVPPQPGVQ